MKDIIVLQGGTGFLGSIIIDDFLKKHYCIRVITRDTHKARIVFGNLNIVDNIEYFENKNSNNIVEAVNNSRVVINTSGAPLDGRRWNSGYKKILYESRIFPTRNIVNAINECKNKPECFININATGYYGDRGDEILTEDSEQGDDFIARLCFDWEKEAENVMNNETRVIRLRTGIVLDSKKGALRKFLFPVKYFAGTYLGNGNQWMPWIHIRDYVKIISFIVNNNIFKGAINGVSPFTVTNKIFNKTLGKIIRRPVYAGVPKFALKILIGEITETLMSSQKVIPEVLLNCKFEYQYADLESALNNLLNI